MGNENKFQLSNVELKAFYSLDKTLFSKYRVLFDKQILVGANIIGLFYGVSKGNQSRVTWNGAYTNRTLRACAVQLSQTEPTLFWSTF